MRRQEILNNFQVSSFGSISSPGKFEGEQLYVVHFWDLALDGCGETMFDGDLEITIFPVNAEDRKEFPELEGVSQVAVYENEQGFVFCVDNPDLSKLNADFQSDLNFNEYDALTAY